MNLIKKIFPQKIKNIYHLAQALVANFYYGFPGKKIKVIAVTGTNGKTTTVQMIAKIFEEAGYKTALASTINFKIGDKEWVNKTKFTTLSAFAVQKFIRQAIEEGCDYLILEVSSHSLDQNRVWGINWEIAVITNVTREHLDYHRTMNDYRWAKLKLFKEAKKIVVNLNMEKPEEFLKARAKEKWGYSVRTQNLKFKISDDNKYQTTNVKTIVAEEINLGIKKSEFKIQSTRRGEWTKFKLNLLGEFNVENALAAISVAQAEGIDLDIAARALEKIKGVSGRIEYVLNDKGLNIIIDYAVTPDSLEKLYSLLKKINCENKNIIAVFGACGERDRGKRPLMGEIVSRYADYLIVTNEDPYHEDPWQIIEEVASGIKNKKEGDNFWKIFDRREAIKKALKIAKEGDFVVVTGKGAEETMAIGNKRIAWNDKKVILEELNFLEPNY